MTVVVGVEVTFHGSVHLLMRIHIHGSKAFEHFGRSQGLWVGDG